MTFPGAVLLLFGELIILSLISRRLTQTLFVLMYRLTRSKTVALTTLIILLFPGTVVHELAHLFVAEVLRVRTGKLTLIPDNIEEEEIKTGSVVIAKTDPLRRSLIGLAPVYVGIITLAGLSYFLQINSIKGITIIIYYIMFAVSNSMFSSKEDMKGVIPFAITVGIFITVGYFAGFRIGLTDELVARIGFIIQILVRSLGIVFIVNLAAFIATLTISHIRDIL